MSRETLEERKLKVVQQIISRFRKTKNDFLNHNNNINSTNDDDTYNLHFFDDHNEQMLVIEGEIRKFVFFTGRRF